VSSPERPAIDGATLLEIRAPLLSSWCVLYASRRRGDGMPGCGREEVSGVLSVARDPVVMMLTMAGVAPTLVVGGKRGRREKGEGSLGRPLALGHGYGLGRLELGREKERGRRELGHRSRWAEAAAGPPAALIGPRERKQRSFSPFLFFEK
jgi:hypothetical protein